jgi:RNA polymerase sigma-70 factor (sigma-E family)
MPPPRRDDDFASFVAADSTRLLRSAYLLTGSRPAAEDLLQDALERTYVAWHRVDDPYAYVRTALTRAAINQWRTRRRRPQTELADRHQPVADDGSDARADRSVLLAALDRLPRRQRAVIVLRYLDDLSEAETAAAMGCSVGTVKSHTSRALTALRTSLGALPELAAPRRQP